MTRSLARPLAAILVLSAIGLHGPHASARQGDAVDSADQVEPAALLRVHEHNLAVSIDLNGSGKAGETDEGLDRTHEALDALVKSFGSLVDEVRKAGLEDGVVRSETRRMGDGKLFGFRFRDAKHMAKWKPILTKALLRWALACPEAASRAGYSGVTVAIGPAVVREYSGSDLRVGEAPGETSSNSNKWNQLMKVAPPLGIDRLVDWTAGRRSVIMIDHELLGESPLQSLTGELGKPEKGVRLAKKPAKQGSGRFSVIRVDAQAAARHAQALPTTLARVLHPRRQVANLRPATTHTGNGSWVFPRHPEVLGRAAAAGGR